MEYLVVKNHDGGSAGITDLPFFFRLEREHAEFGGGTQTKTTIPSLFIT